jgi:hypothetical protein
MGQVFRSFYQFDTKPQKQPRALLHSEILLQRNTESRVVGTRFLPDLKPETSVLMKWVIGVAHKKLLVDAYVYYSQYKDFIARVAVGRGESASSNPPLNYRTGESFYNQ